MRIANFFRDLFRRTTPNQIHRLPRPLGRRRRDPEMPANISCSAKINSTSLPRRKVA
jgi:hypothetical protein